MSDKKIIPSKLTEIKTEEELNSINGGTMMRDLYEAVVKVINNGDSNKKNN